MDIDKLFIRLYLWDDKHFNVLSNYYLKKFLTQIVLTIFECFMISKNRQFFLIPGIIKRSVKSLFGVLQLRSIFICPSHQCNANCVHCYEKFQYKKEDFMTTKTVKKIIDQFKELGGTWIYFCSGEFVMRKDAIEIVRYAHKKKMGIIIVSNGILMDEEKIEELKKAGLSGLIISIDSADPKKHDRWRGVKGCHEKAINALKIAKRKRLFTAIWSYVLKNTQNELEGTSKLAKKIKVDFFFVYLPLLSGHLYNRFDLNLTAEERDKLRVKFPISSKTNLEFTSEKHVCVGGGENHIAVMPTGDMTFCPPVVFSYGNIYKDSLRKGLIRIKKDYKRFKHCTGQCPINFPEYREKCRGKFLYKKEK